MSDKIKLNIDGQIVEATAGASLLQVAIDNNTMVPHFCYHPGIGIEGSCRLCLVEIEGMPKMVTSCTIPVKEGMVVKTQSPQATAARKSVLEFFLLNHPLDCPFCDKGGECPLQNFTLDSGQFTTRFEFQKVHKAKHEVIGEHIILDKERCVLCDRCVRFGRDLAGHEELQIGSRGNHAEIFVAEGEKLRSKFTGNYADICPVGALTSRAFRFKARPWEMKTENTICGECSVGCNVQVWKKETQVLRLTPRIAPDVNEWWLCDKGRYSIHQHLVESRLKAVYKNEHASWRESKASDFVSFAKDLIKSEKPVALVAGLSSTNEEFASLKQIAASHANVKLYLPISSASFAFAKAVKDAGLALSSPTDFEKSDTMVIVGENLEDSHPVLALRVRRLVKTKGKKLITVAAEKSDLSDVRLENIAFSKSQSSTSSVIKSITAALKDQSDATFVMSEQSKKALQTAQKICLMISDSWINVDSMPALEELVQVAKQQSGRISIVYLLHGSNTRGLMDASDEHVLSMDALDKHAEQADLSVLWLDANKSDVLDRVEKLGRLVARAASDGTQKPQSQWMIPSESFVEKRGTYTNLFGKIQVLRKTTRVVPKGEALSEVISEMRNQIAGGQMDAAQLYQLVVKSNSNYPQSLDLIPENKETYHHYERALWR